MQVTFVEVSALSNIVFITTCDTEKLGQKELQRLEHLRHRRVGLFEIVMDGARLAR